MTTRRFLPAMIAVALAAVLLVAPATSASAEQPRGAVDQSLLVPSLSTSFAPWECKARRTGPVCSGERHQDLAPEPLDLPCDVPLWAAYSEDRYQTRYYDQNNLNYFRTFRTKHEDSLSTSEAGPVTGRISTNVRFFETFAVRGDDTTMTITTHGTILDIAPSRGRAVLRVQGTLVEPYNAPATFSGLITSDGGSTRYDDAAFEEALTFEMFAGAVCEAARG